VQRNIGGLRLDMISGIWQWLSLLLMRVAAKTNRDIYAFNMKLPKLEQVLKELSIIDLWLTSSKEVSESSEPIRWQTTA
jgi:hypothetical protein